MNRTLIIAWLAALFSNTYTQTTSYLRREEIQLDSVANKVSFCALGVAGDQCVKSGQGRWESSLFAYEDVSLNSYLPPSIRRQLGLLSVFDAAAVRPHLPEEFLGILNDNKQYALDGIVTHLNDTVGLCFEEIGLFLYGIYTEEIGVDLPPMEDIMQLAGETDAGTHRVPEQSTRETAPVEVGA